MCVGHCFYTSMFLRDSWLDHGKEEGPTMFNVTVYGVMVGVDGNEPVWIHIIGRRALGRPSVSVTPHTLCGSGFKLYT